MISDIGVWILDRLIGDRLSIGDRTSAGRPSLRETKARLALDEAVRMLEAQTRRIEGIRARAATVVGVAGIGATFVATRSSDLDGVSLSVSSASVLLFAAAIAVALWAIVPQDLFFGVSSEALLEELGADGVELSTTYETLSTHFEKGYDRNELVVQRMVERFSWSVVLLLLGLLVLIGSMLISLGSMVISP